MSGKKLKRKLAPEPSMADRVKDSAHQIWLAGLGAFSRAQAEGQKVFDTLVQQGESLATQTKNIAASTIGEAQKAMGKTASDVKAGADDTWNKLESVFENRVSRALKQLNIPSAEDIANLTKQVEQLHKQVAAMKAAGKPAKKATPKSTAKSTAKSPAKRPAKTKAKPSVARRAAAKKVARKKTAGKKVAKKKASKKKSAKK